MSTLEALRTALSALGANKLRSGLTVLGLCIGVAAVIALVAVGNGSKQQVEASINALGSNLLVVQTQAGGFGPGSQGASVSRSTKDAPALEDRFNAPDVKSASPVVNASGTTLTAGSTSYEPSSLIGTTPSYLTTRDLKLASGTGITTKDVTDHERKVVL